MYMVAVAWGMLLLLGWALWWSARRLHRAGDREECERCGYERAGLHTRDPCPECSGRTWVLGYERLRGSRRVQRFAIALLPVTIGMSPMGSLALRLQPRSLAYVSVIIAVTYSVLTLVLCVRYTYRAARQLLTWGVAVGVGCSAFQFFVAWAYWTGPVDPEDFGWPLTDVVLASLVCFVFTLIACPLIWVLTAGAGTRRNPAAPDVAS